MVSALVLDPEERKKNLTTWLDSIALKKRVLFLHGASDNSTSSKRGNGNADAEMMATVPVRTSEPNTMDRGTARYRGHQTSISYGNNIINESLADGIPVIMEQEFNDGQVRTEVVTWLPKLDIFVRRDFESIQDDNKGHPRVGADANAHFTSWDTASQVASAPGTEVVTNFQFIDAASYRYPRLSLYSSDVKRGEDLQTENDLTSPQYIKNVIIRPVTPSEDILPSTRQEIIWKPPLGICTHACTYAHFRTHTHTRDVEVFLMSRITCRRRRMSCTW